MADKSMKQVMSEAYKLQSRLYAAWYVAIDLVSETDDLPEPVADEPKPRRHHEHLIEQPRRTRRT